MAYTIHGVTLYPTIQPDYDYSGEPRYCVAILDQIGQEWANAHFYTKPTPKQIRTVLRDAVRAVNKSVAPYITGAV